MADLRKCIVGQWIHSHEEDTQDVTVYRPASYDFPPSRGRMGFEFRKDGKLIYYGIARADGSDQIPGSWVIEGAEPDQDPGGRSAQTSLYTRGSRLR